jgi:hypothetical protein
MRYIEALLETYYHDLQIGYSSSFITIQRTTLSHKKLSHIFKVTIILYRLCQNWSAMIQAQMKVNCCQTHYDVTSVPEIVVELQLPLLGKVNTLTNLTLYMRYNTLVHEYKSRNHNSHTSYFKRR